MAEVSIRWARNTSEDLGEDGTEFHDVDVQNDNGTIYLTRDGNLVAKFSEHDAAVLLVR